MNENNIVEKQINRRTFIKKAIIAASIAITTSISSKNIYTRLNEDNNFNNTNLADYFYDDNSSGVDDVFELSVPNHETLINELSQLESYIEIIINNEQIYNEIKESRKQELINLYTNKLNSSTAVLNAETSLEYLSKEINTYNKLNENQSGKTEELNKIREKLFCCFLIINNELRLNGYNLVANFGVQLIKSIIITASDNSLSADDITIASDTSSHYKLIKYKKGNKIGKIFIKKSVAYSIIDKLQICQEQSKKAPITSPQFNGEYNKDRLIFLLNTINTYKTAFEQVFFIERNFLSDTFLLSSKKTSSKSL